MYDPADTITLTIPRHTAHLLNSFAVAEHGNIQRSSSRAAARADDMKALEDYIRAYADAAQRR
jgi:hypothetical protein